MKKIIKTVISLLFPDKFILKRVKNSSNKVAITFDDGPHPVNTKKLLGVLKNEAVKATFFVSGSEAEKYPELVSEIKNNGHEIGNHSYSHKKISEIGIEKYSRDIKKTSALIGDTALFRPPYGEISMSLLKLISKNDLKYIGWTVDSKDSYIKDKDKLVESMKSRVIREGDIILFHEDYASTVEAMRQIVIDLKARGFKLVRMSELEG